MNVTGTVYNTDTGSSSNNQATVNISSNQTDTTTNNATITSSYNVQTTSGNVDVSNNTVAGDVTTGDTTVAFATNNQANTGSSVTAAADPGTDITVTSGNEGTGSNSLNVASHTVTSNTNQTVTNTATITNQVQAVNTSGNVRADNNTELGTVRTGSFTANFSLNNTANTAPLVAAAPPTTSGGGVGGGVGGDVPGPISGGGGGTTVSTSTTPTLGVGGTFLPLPTAAPEAASSSSPEATITLASVAQPTSLGVGGGFFPAGSSLLSAENLVLLLVSFLVVFGYAPFRRRFTLFLEELKVSRKEGHE